MQDVLPVSKRVPLRLRTSNVPASMSNEAAKNLFSIAKLPADGRSALADPGKAAEMPKSEVDLMKSRRLKALTMLSSRSWTIAGPANSLTLVCGRPGREGHQVLPRQGIGIAQLAATIHGDDQQGTSRPMAVVTIAAGDSESGTRPMDSTFRYDMRRNRLERFRTTGYQPARRGLLMAVI
jgi:hypothetical protein